MLSFHWDSDGRKCSTGQHTESTQNSNAYEEILGFPTSRRNQTAALHPKVSVGGSANQQRVRRLVVMRRPSVRYPFSTHRFAPATAHLQEKLTTHQAFSPETAVRPPVALCSLSGPFLTYRKPTTTASQHRPVPLWVLSDSFRTTTPQTQTSARCR